ncbi:hypothetical protein FHX74_000208 [Friedmanniella endophytica]|uniref:YCII-related domain-containing protein n=1 Tax=Microlunatus kandeliicorticis TaxID=1759536 RepID=A0A7W3P476_9ACTN|nr:YciI family protein [Microlunatus kandeliicorticis]MBA8792614.1 hypothetical protein [Microlunatus kandeliicorticis]
MPTYLIGVTFAAGAEEVPMDQWRPEEIQAHLDYYAALDAELRRTGELVGGSILTGPDLAKIVTVDPDDPDRAPVVSDGPFAEFKEWLAGFQLVEVDSEERAVEIAALVSAVPGRGGRPTAQPIQLRRVMDDTPGDVTGMEAYLRTADGPAHDSADDSADDSAEG